MDNKNINDHIDPKHMPGRPDTSTKPGPDSKSDPEVEIKKELMFDDNVLQKIVGKTASEVDGVMDLSGNIFSDMTDRFRKTDNLKKGVSVDIEDNKRVTVELDAIMKYGTKAPEVFDQVTDAICHNIKEMTGMDVTGIKLTVKDMMTDEEIQAQKDADENTEKKESQDDKDLQPA